MMRSENKRLTKKRKKKDVINTHILTNSNAWREVRTSLERKRKRENISTWNACKNYIAACI